MVRANLLAGVCRRVSVSLTLFAAIARAAPAASVDLAVRNGDVALAATLLTPETPGPHPAVVLMGGSGPSTRGDLMPMAQQIVSRGWGVLTYDKRGCGASTGDWTTTSLSELADDAAAAVSALSARPEVDRQQIGLWGVSNSGWVGPLAASRASAAAFLVVFTGGGARPREVETFGYRKRIERAHLSPEQTADAMRVVDSYFRYLETGAGLAELKATLADPAHRPWADALGLARVLPDERGRPAWEWVATYDPVPDISRLRIPTLVLCGGRDEEGPTTESVAGWTAGLAAAGNPRSRVLVIPTASHAMTAGHHVDPAAAHHGDPHAAPQWAPGVFDEVVAWEKGNRSPS